MTTLRRRAMLLQLSWGLVLYASFAGCAQADDLGRLFTSAAERARIDAAHSGRDAQTDTPASVSNTARVVINGTLHGSDGKRLVWVNGAPVNPQSTRNLSLLRDGRVQLTWRDGARILKPGQGVDPASGEIFEHHTPVPVPDIKDTAAATKPAATPPPATAPAATPATVPAAATEPPTTAAATTKPAPESPAK